MDMDHDLLGTARVPGDGAELRCFHLNGEYSIWVDGNELMSSHTHGSEQALAELSLARLGPRVAPRVLVGGLGMGFTLGRALALVDAQAQVDVAELVPEVVTWNRELLGQFAGHPLRDPRTHLIVGDVGAVLSGAPAVYDAVMLDVDNGPARLSRSANDDLYADRGLATAREALRPGGVLAVWSTDDNPVFDARLRRCGFHVKKHTVRSRRTHGPQRTIWVALRREPGVRR